MLSKKALKQVGILGVSFGLIASPLAFGFEDEPKSDPTQEQYQDPAQSQEAGDPQAGQSQGAQGGGYGDGTAPADPAAGNAQGQGAEAQPQGETYGHEEQEGETREDEGGEEASGGW